MKFLPRYVGRGIPRFVRVPSSFHGYVTLPSRLVGAVLGDSDVSTSAAWSTVQASTYLEGLMTQVG